MKLKMNRLSIVLHYAFFCLLTLCAEGALADGLFITSTTPSPGAVEIGTTVNFTSTCSGADVRCQCAGVNPLTFEYELDGVPTSVGGAWTACGQSGLFVFSKTVFRCKTISVRTSWSVFGSGRQVSDWKFYFVTAPECQAAPSIIGFCNGLPVTVDLNQGHVATSTDDVILGTDGADIIRGKGGNDTICGMGGDDFIHGNSGDDWIDGGEGVDDLRGGQGADEIYTGIGGTVGTSSRAFGGYGDDYIYGAQGADVLRGGRGADTIEGDGGDDDIAGNQDDDLMYGDGGNDVLKGGGQHDIMFGGSGDDSLNGGSGIDACDAGVDAGDTSTNCES